MLNEKKIFNVKTNAIVNLFYFLVDVYVSFMLLNIINIIFINFSVCILWNCTIKLYEYIAYRTVS